MKNPHPDRRFVALAARVRSLIAPVIRECPRTCGIVTITSVEISSDYAFATVTISALAKPELALEYLEGRQRDLQKMLGRLGTKSTPRLRIRIDRDSQRSTRLDALLEGDATEMGMSNSLDNPSSQDSSESPQGHHD